LRDFLHAGHKQSCLENATVTHSIFIAGFRERFIRTLWGGVKSVDLAEAVG